MAKVDLWTVLGLLFEYRIFSKNTIGCSILFRLSCGKYFRYPCKFFRYALVFGFYGCSLLRRLAVSSAPCSLTSHSQSMKHSPKRERKSAKRLWRSIFSPYRAFLSCSLPLTGRPASSPTKRTEMTTRIREELGSQ